MCRSLRFRPVIPPPGNSRGRPFQSCRGLGIGRGDIKVVAAVPRPADVEADTTWVYWLDVRDERMFMSPSALYHMAYGHEKLESCRERMLETAEWTVKFHRSPDESQG